MNSTLLCKVVWQPTGQLTATKTLKDAEREISYLWNIRPLNVPNDNKFIISHHGGHTFSFMINLVSFRVFQDAVDTNFTVVTAGSWWDLFERKLADLILLTVDGDVGGVLANSSHLTR